MRLRLLAMLVVVPIVAALAADTDAPPRGDAKRGQRIAALGGCASCHTGPDGVAYAGGHAIETRFGTFYGPNLTQDATDGIGRWTWTDFRRAMREGRAPDGTPYYPAFPYPAFTNMGEQDLVDLWAFVRTIKPVKKPDHQQDVLGRYASRIVIGTWRSLEFEEGPFVADPAQPPEVNRGAYLGTAIGHCGECHTPRNTIGGLIEGRELAGTDEPPQEAPNITPSSKGIGGWSEDDLLSFLATGIKPDGDVVGGEMGRIVRDGTSKLPEADRRAIVAWLRSVRPTD